MIPTSEVLEQAKWSTMKPSIFILLLLWLPESKGSIEITEGPSNHTAYIGDSVTLTCRYTGTVDLPKWRVGTSTFSSSSPPTGYEYSDEGLQIPSVWSLLNNTVIVCFFTILVGGGRLENIESQPAFISVKIRYVSPTDHIPPTDRIPTAFSASTSRSHHIWTTFAGQSFIKTTLGRPLYTSSSPFVASSQKMSTPSPTLPVPQSPYRMTPALPLIGGITFGVGVSFLFVTIIIASVCLFICRHMKRVSESVISEQEVKMQENPAYETLPSGINMKKNEAYIAQ